MYNIHVIHENRERQAAPAPFWQRARLDRRGRAGRDCQEGQGRRPSLPSAPKTKAKKIKLPNFAARQKRIFGDRVLPGNIVAEERESYEW